MVKAYHYANVLDSRTRKHEKLEIASVLENASNKDYARRNVITKGAVIKVKRGSEQLKAPVNSRPGQSSTINAVLQQ